MSVIEGDSGATAVVFTVSLSPPEIERTVTVDVATSDGTATAASGDYAPLPRTTLTFLPDDTTKTVVVPIGVDTRNEGAETFFVDLSNATNATIAVARGQATILDDDPAGTIQFSAARYDAAAPGVAVITVTRTDGDASDVGVTFRTEDGTAVAGVDYLPASGPLVFGADETVKTFAVPVLANPQASGDRTVRLILDDPTGGGTLGTPSTAVLVIRNPVNPFLVTTTADEGPGSLRNALFAANAIVGANTITFAIPGPGPFVIRPTSALPTIAEAATIDATTQPGFAGTPIVGLDGAGAGADVDGLAIEAGASAVRGLVIVRFDGDGIELRGGGGSRVVGNNLGTDAFGSAGLGNGGNGVRVVNSPGNTIGGTAAADRNLLSGNRLNGVEITGPAASSNVVLGNLIGTDPTGTRSLGNVFDGVYIEGAPGNTIGGLGASARNVISGNQAVGVQITDPSASGNVVLGNFIGTDTTGTVAVGNTYDGVYIEGAPGNTIGGVTPGAGNVISGNRFTGIRIFDRTGTGNVVLGNLIGIDATGTRPLGNAFDGVFILTAPGNTIGGVTPGAGNVISGNGSVGLQVFGAGATGNAIAGNLIGTDVTGLNPLGNARDGVFLNGVSGNTVGGVTPGAGNVISGNGSVGLQVFARGTGNLIAGNAIGTDIQGRPRLGNAFGLFINSAPGNVIPTSGPARNVIAGNLRANVIEERGASGPVVMSVAASGLGTANPAITLTFSAPMDAARARRLGNYRLQAVGRGSGPRGGRIALRSAVYDPIARTVTLTPARPLDAAGSYRLTVDGSPRRGLTDEAGVALDGNGDGRPGGNFVARIGRR